MTKTCSAPTVDQSSPAYNEGRIDRMRMRAFTLIELIVVLSTLALVVGVAQVSLFGALRKSEFNSQVQDFVSTMQMAAYATAETGRRYEIIIDIGDQSYLLRQITSSDLAVVKQEEIIANGQFGDNCRVSYVMFDDGQFENNGLAKFRVGRTGWHYGGKVVFLDNAGSSHTVSVSRLTPIVEMIDGDPELMKPKAKEEVPFL